MTKVSKSLIIILSIIMLLSVVSLFSVDNICYAINSKTLVEGKIKDVSITYGDMLPSFEIEYTSYEQPLYVAFKPINSTDCGSYDILIDEANSDPNFDYSGINKGILQINQRSLTLQPISVTKNYGEKDPVFDYQNTNGSLLTGHSITNINITREPGENVNEIGYTINIDKNSIVIKSDNKDVTANYNIIVNPGKFTINKINLNTKSLDINTYYNSTISPTLESNIPTYFGNEPKIEFNTINTNEVGVFDIIYNIKFFNGLLDVTSIMEQNIIINKTYGKLKVNKIKATITPITKTFIYGSEGDIEYNIEYSNIKPENDILIGKLSRDRATDKKVGKYKILLGTIQIKDGEINKTNNYEINLVDSYIEICAKPIEITFDKITSIYGEPEVTFDKYNKLLQNNMEFKDGTNLKFIRENSYDKNCGVYNIKLNENIGNNYTLLLKNNKYEITKREIEIKPIISSKEYGEPDNLITWEIISGSIVNNDYININYIRETGESIGKYKVSLSEVNDTNYIVKSKIYNFEITPKTLTVKGIIIPNKRFDGTNVANIYYAEDFGLVGIVNNDEVKLETVGTLGLRAEFDNKEIGKNKAIKFTNINISGKDKDNYIIKLPIKYAHITPNQLVTNDIIINTKDSTVIENDTTLNIIKNVAQDQKGLDINSTIKLYPTILATYDVELKKNGEPCSPNGILEYKVLIPDEFKNIHGLKVAVVLKDDSVQLMDTIVSGDYLIFSTDFDIKTIEIVSENNMPIYISAIVLAVISLIVIIGLVIYAIIRKTKKTKKS